MLTIQEIKNYLGDKSIVDSDISQIEEMAIGYINSLLSYNIEEATYVYECDSIPNSTYLPQYPINSITSVEVFETGDIFDSPILYPIEDFKIQGTAGKIISKNYISNPVRITYIAGYTNATVPKELKLAILELCKYILGTKNGSGKVRSETVDGDKIEFFDTNSSKIQEINTILYKFYRYDLVA